MAHHRLHQYTPATLADLAKLESNSLGQLVATLRDGTVHVDVQAVRGFPISQAAFGISLVNDDGNEVLWLRDINECPVEMQKLLNSSLQMRDFLPQIQRIYNISSNHEPCEWDVQTDRGRVKFVLKHDEDVRRLDATRAIVTDAHGVQYLMPNVKSVDTVTRRYIERYMHV
jgi:hypothetical protein